MKELLEAGAHFGHQKGRRNPKMARYIYAERNGLHLIDLSRTKKQIDAAIEIVQRMAAETKSILFVGTKKQAKEVIREAADHCGELYVAERWLGGQLTNLDTIKESLKKLERIEKEIATGTERFKKKEIVRMTKLQGKLEKNLSGVRAMKSLPGLVIVVDPMREHIAVAEARKLGIPVMALVDTNCDPDLVDHVIACNDDSLKCIKLIVDALAAAILAQKSKRRVKEEKEAILAEKESE